MNFTFKINGQTYLKHPEFFAIEKNLKDNKTTMYITLIEETIDLNYSEFTEPKFSLKGTEIPFTPIDMVVQTGYISERQDYGVTIFITVEEDSDDLFNELESC